MQKLFKRLVIVFLFLYTSATLANQTLPIEINGESYQIQYWPSYFAKNLDVQYMDSSETDENKVDIKFYRGEIVGHPDSQVTLSKVGDKLQGLAFFYDQYYEIDGSMSSLSNQFSAPMQSSQVDVTDMAERMTQEMCPIHTQEHHDMHMTAMATMSMNTSGSPPVAFAVGNVNLVADVALVLDPQYVLVHGGANNAVVKALQALDQADMFYRQAKPAVGAGGLGIALNNVSINVYANALPFGVADIIDPAPSLLNGNQPEIDATAYLNRIQANGAALFGNLRTVGAMFTGYDLDDAVVGDGVAGLAFLSSSCSTLGVSVSEGWGTDAASAVIAAHEIGHNFGSCHDGDPIVNAALNICPISSVGCPANGPYIMAPFVNPAATQFSSCSIANIDSHINVQTCYKQPIDIQILLQNVVPAVGTALTQGNTSVRTFSVGNMTDVAVMNVDISGSLANLSDPNNPNTEYMTVTLDGNGCSIAANRQSFTCTAPTIAANNAQTLTLIETISATGIGQFMSTTEYQNVADAQQVDVVPQNSIVEITQNINAAVTPPVAPSNVQATSLSNGTIQVSWTDNSNNEEAFIIDRSEDGGAMFNVIANNIAANSTSYIDSNVVEGTTYTYRVSASNAIGGAAAANSPSATASASAPASSEGGGGGGGAFYLLTLFLLFARAITKFR